MQLADGMRYEGEMSDPQTLKGKVSEGSEASLSSLPLQGTLQMPNGDTIQGDFDGNLLHGEVVMSNARFARVKMPFLESPTTAHVMQWVYYEKAFVNTTTSSMQSQEHYMSQYACPVQRRWLDILYSWLKDHLGIKHVPAPDSMQKKTDSGTKRSEFGSVYFSCRNVRPVEQLQLAVLPQHER